MSVGIRIDESIEIPPGIDSLEAFRRWAFSPDFPEQGRIDYLRGMIEVDMSPERMISHGGVKTAVARRLTERVLDADLGDVFIDGMRISSEQAALSREPDLFVLLHSTLESGRVRQIPSSEVDGDFIELQGGPDLVVEIVNPSSVAKDTQLLPSAYFEAGVREFWLIDARGEELRFQIFRRSKLEFVETESDEEGFQPSEVLDRRYRLTRSRGRGDRWRFVLEERAME